jgi:hypothetical protein
MLFNEYELIVRQGQRIFLAGVDDPHFYRADDIAKAASQVPSNAFSILLAHTPEVYDQAASAGFNLMLCGHTHGGQLCLPGGIPIKLAAVLPREMGAGAWRHRDLVGYNSDALFNGILTGQFMITHADRLSSDRYVCNRFLNRRANLPLSLAVRRSSPSSRRVIDTSAQEISQHRTLAF